MQYIIEGGLLVFFISSLVVINKEITKRPTTKEIEEKYTEIKLCKEIHKSTNEKLECIPKIKDTVARLETKIDILLNGRNNS